MAKKNKRKKGIVFSTNPDYDYDLDGENEVEETLPPQQQNLKVSRHRLKGNKMVTRVTGFVGAEDDLKDLGKTLKSKCGCGGTVKDEMVILQGDFKDKVGGELQKMGYKFKFSGG